MDTDYPRGCEQVSSCPNLSVSDEEELFDSLKNRTPSGNIISTNVKEVCEFFAPGNKELKKKQITKIKSGKEVVPVNTNSQSVQPAVAKKFKDKAKSLSQKVSTNMGDSVDTKTVNHDDMECETSDSKEQSKRRFIEAKDLPDISPEELQNLSKTISDEQFRDHLKKNMPAVAASFLSQQSNTARMGTAIINDASVIEMLNDIKQKVSTLQKDVDEIKKHEVNIDQDTVKRWSNQVADKVSLDFNEDHKEDINKLKSDLKHFKYRNRTLTDVVQRMSIEMEEIKTKLDNLELSGSRKAISLSGFNSIGKKIDVVRNLEHFFEKNLGVYVNVEEYYRMGALTIVYLQTSQEKRDIMRFKHHLKGIKNGDGYEMYINDYIPSAAQEKRKQEQGIFKDNEKSENPMELKYNKGKLMIQGEVFKPKVSAPSPKQLVDVEPQDLAEILKLELESGGVIRQEKNIFEGFTAGVRDHAQIRDLYVKIKLIQPSARHVICAYFLPGEEEKHYQQGYCDNGKHGAGKVVLNFLTKHNLVNRVIFISRKCGDIKMGSERFDCYLEAAKTAIMANPRNSVTGSDQTINKVPESEKIGTEKKTEKPEKPVMPEKDVKFTGLKRPAESPEDRRNVRGRGSQSTRRSRMNWGGRYQRYTPTGRNLVTERNPWQQREQQRSYGPSSKYYPSQQTFQHSNDWEYGVDDWSNESDRSYYKRSYVNDRDRDINW